jgi:regulatory protein
VKKLRKDNFKQALAYAFLLLKYRVRSKRETIARLDKKGYAPETIQQVADYLQEHKYLDDGNFTYSFIEYAIAKGWGPRKIDYELKKFGIADDLRKEALTKANHQQQLRLLIEQKLKLYGSRNKKAPFIQIRQKVLRLLMARGFSYQEIVTMLEDKGAEYSEDS